MKEQQKIDSFEGVPRVSSCFLICMDIPLLTDIKYGKKRIYKANNDSIHIISQIKESLSGDKFQQAYGCCLLHVVLSKCDDALFEDNATSWIRFIMKYLNTFPQESNVNLCYEIIITILDKSINFDKLARDIGTKGIDVILSFLRGSSAPIVVNTFSLISCCVKRYPNSCGRFRQDLERIIASHIFSLDCQVSMNACSCYSLLPICGSGGEKKKMFKENWSVLLKSVLFTAHHNCVLFTNAVSGEETDQTISYGEAKILEFELPTELHDNETKSKLHLEKCLIILKAMLSSSYGFDVQIPVSLLVRLFCEVGDLCNIDCNDEAKQEHTFVMISNIIGHLLSLISVCLSQFSSCLMPYFSFITKLFCSLISASCMFDRSALYCCFTNTIYQWKVIPGNSKLLQEFFEYILKDIQIASKDVADTTDKQMLPAKKQKKKVKTYSQRFQADLDKYFVKHHVIEDIHQRKNNYHALVALRQCILNLGPVLPVKMLEITISCVLQTLKSIYSSLKYPYNCQKNRMELYKVLFSLLNLNHDGVVLPCSVFLSFLQIGANDSDDQIKEFCEECLLTCDRFIHGCVISLKNSNPTEIESTKAELLLNNRKDVLSRPLGQYSVGHETSQDMLNTQQSIYRDDKVMQENTVDKPNTVLSLQRSHSPVRCEVVNPPGSSVPMKETSPITLPRQCKSADQISPSKELPSPRRPNSEPLMQPLLHANRADLQNGGEDEDVVVVESDEESDGSVTEIVQLAKKRGKSRNCEEQITTKKQRIESPTMTLTAVEPPANNNNSDVNCVDDEVEAILTTFNEVAAD